MRQHFGNDKMRRQVKALAEAQYDNEPDSRQGLGKAMYVARAIRKAGLGNRTPRTDESTPLRLRYEDLTQSEAAELLQF